MKTIVGQKVWFYECHNRLMKVCNATCTRTGLLEARGAWFVKYLIYDASKICWFFYKTA